MPPAALQCMNIRARKAVLRAARLVVTPRHGCAYVPRQFLWRTPQVLYIALCRKFARAPLPHMFIRFIIHAKDQNSGRRRGLFQAMSDLEESGRLLPHEQEQYDAIYNWFRENLKKPRSFARSSRPHARNVALSWYKDSATAYIAKMHDVSRILDARGIAVEVLHVERPGYIVYEDAHQVAAEPFKETAT